MYTTSVVTAPFPCVSCRYGTGRRFAGTLAHNARAAIHWDNHLLEQELVIRPVGKDW